MRVRAGSDTLPVCCDTARRPRFRRKCSLRAVPPGGMSVAFPAVVRSSRGSSEEAARTTSELDTQEETVNHLEKLYADDGGQGMTEYAILVGTLALGAILTLVAIGSRIKEVFTNVQTQLNNVPTS